MAALAAVGLADELWSGVAVVAAPEVEVMHGVSHAQYALWIFAVPLLLAALIEAPLALVSDRLPRRFLLASALGALALSVGLAALAPTPWLLSAALALAGGASGVACSTAQAELVTRHPAGAQRAMTRWIAFAAAGDALTPAFVGVAYWAGGTHRNALGCVAGVLALQAVGTLWSAMRASGAGARPLDVDEEVPTLSMRQALTTAARKPKLWLFLVGAACCVLLDEVVVALAALRLHDDLGWSDGSVALAMTGFSSGCVLGAVVSERLLARVSPRLLLACASVASSLLLCAFILADSAAVAATALCALGTTCALHYPLVKAAAYELMPGQPGVVNALAQALVGVEIVLPMLSGAIASGWGLTAGLASLVLEPLLLLFVAALWQTRPGDKA